MSLPYLQEALTNLFKRPSTRSFPKEIPPAAPAYRGRLVYHADKCINCGLCTRVCAPQAITKTVEKDENGDEHITMEFHMGSCTFCNTCADFCSRHAIELTEDYMIVVTDEDDLKVRGSFIKKKPAPRPPAAKAAAPAPAQEGCTES